jgi:hypothetical protein
MTWTRTPRPAPAIPVLTVLALAGCAHVEAPSGGPEDKAPPQLLVSRPAADAVVPNWRSPVVLVFDERLSERGIDQAVEVSPRTSAVVVRHSGDELRVSLREGWRPGTVYHVRVLPGLRDLFSNQSRDPIRLVFSTGPPVPDTHLSGEALYRTTGTPSPDLRVEAIRMADSLVYAAATDSIGRFVVANLPTGDYLVRAFDDLNANQALDAFEPRDTARAAITDGDSARITLSVVPPDSTAPRVASATVRERVVTITFDDLLDPAQVIPPREVEVRTPSGDSIGVSRVAVGALPQAPAADTAAGGVARAQPPADTAAALQAASRPPSRDLLIELREGSILEPGAEHAVTVRAVRNIVGLEAEVATRFTPPAAAGDTTTQVPPGPRRSLNPN